MLHTTRPRVILETQKDCHGELNRQANYNAIKGAELTNLRRKGKYHCTADLLFDCFGF